MWRDIARSAAEISKVITSFLKAVEAARVAEFAARITELTYAQLMAIAAGGTARNGTFLTLPGQDGEH